ncbi:MAG: hypothetical protein DHS20C18_41080 [Saprospiraceae bacterium]|nr:MAG: hypothetical protein DHS20C18_41080 [Saprospiraceae bacterium]
MKNPKSRLLVDILRLIKQAAYLEKNNIQADDLFQEWSQNEEISRRKFLKTSLTAVAGITLGSTILSCSPKLNQGSNSDIKFDKKQPRIAIIGGGIAGLHCAYILKKANIRSTIYEADRRVGGRIFTKSGIFGENLTTEFGGEFIDSNHTDMLNLIQEFNLNMNDGFVDFANKAIVKDAYYFDRRHHSETEVIKEFRKIVDTLELDRQACGEDYDTPHCEKLDHTSLEAYVRDLKCDTWLQDLIIYAYTAEFGLDAGEQSAMNFIDMIGTDTSEGFQIFGSSDERYKIKGGNSLIIEHLTERLKSHIKTERKLTSISSKGNSYSLAFENGKNVTADIVVITIPFTVLREVDMNIAGMTPEKLACIHQLGYGQNNKLIMGFNGRPWRENATSYSGFLFNETIHNGWDSGHMQNDNKGPSSFTAYLGGSPSFELAKSARALGLKDAASNELVQQYLLQLEVVFPGAKNQFTGTHKAALWSNNPFVKASYATYRVGQWTTISGQEFTPINNVYFAGEHCSEDFQGYMNGGAETGRMVAEGIIGRIV